MDLSFLASLPNEPEVLSLRQELCAVAEMDRENPRRLNALGYAVELCIAISVAAGADSKDKNSDRDLLVIAAQGSNMARHGVTHEGPEGPLRLAEILDEICVLASRVSR